MVPGLRWDEAMAQVVQATGCGLVLMHTRGRPPEWKQMAALGPEAMLRHVFSGLVEGVALAEGVGIRTESLVLDPGFAFGKVGAENFALLAELGALHQLGRPCCGDLTQGLSRAGGAGAAKGGAGKRSAPCCSPLRHAGGEYRGHARGRTHPASA